MTKKDSKPDKRTDKPKRKRGRPSSYRPEYAEQARKLCLLKRDATNEDLAKFFEKNVDTIYEWQKVHPEFSEALRGGKVYADAEVANSLYNRATGAVWYEEVAFKVKCVEYDKGRKVKEYEEIRVARVQRAAPPDTPAIALWLHNRRSDLWRKNPAPDQPTQSDIPDDYKMPLEPDESVPDAPIL